jgi:Dolichyl-phosphate-mannose-protein mannosyltransferase
MRQTPSVPQSSSAQRRFPISRNTSLRLVGLALLAAFYLAVPNARPDFSKFNCNDSESYLALAYSMNHGLGYTRSMIPGDYLGHTTWPPGVPILMMPAMALSGDTVNWHAVKFTAISVGIIGILVVWLLGVRITGRNQGGDLLAAAIGLNPFYWDFSHQAMAEGPLCVWIAASMLLVDLAWARRRPTWTQTFLGGAFAGIGMLFKGHAIGLTLAPLAYFIGRRATSFGYSAASLRFAVYVVGFLIPFLGWSVRNSFVSAPGFEGINQVRMIRAKNPCDPNSPLYTIGESIVTVARNLRTYAVYRVPEQTLPFLWLPQISSLPKSGFLYLLLTCMVAVLAMPWNRNEIQSAHMVIMPIVVLNLQYALGGAARFWVPVSFLLTILLALRCHSLIIRLTLTRARLAVGLILTTLATNLAFYVFEHERDPYLDHTWSAKAALFEQSIPLRSKAVGVSTSNCHAFQLITGIPAPMADFPSCQVDHAIIDLRDSRPIPGRLLVQIAVEFPWAMFRLPEPCPPGQVKSFFESAK